MSNEEGLSNPYDPQAVDYAPETPSLGSVLQYALHQHSLHMRVALPCQIVAVNGNQLVDVQPLLMSRYTVTDKATPLPILTNTLVAMPSGGDYSVRYPIAVGDIGYCIFCDRSLDAWASGAGAQVDPQDSRSHDLTDGVFYPGLVPVAGQTSDTTSDLTLKAGAASLRIQGAGTFVIGNGQAELTSLLQELAQAVSSLASTAAASTVVVPPGASGGTFPLLNAGAFSTASGNVQKLATQLQTLVGS